MFSVNVPSKRIKWHRNKKSTQTDQHTKPSNQLINKPNNQHTKPTYKPNKNQIIIKSKEQTKNNKPRNKYKTPDKNNLFWFVYEST